MVCGLKAQFPPVEIFRQKKTTILYIFESAFQKNAIKKRGSHALRRATLISSFVRRKLSVDAHTCVWPRHPRLAAICFLSIALSPEPQFSFWFCGTASGRDRRFTLRIFQAAQRGTTLCRSGRLLDFRPVLAPSPDMFGTARSEIRPAAVRNDSRPSGFIRFQIRYAYPPIAIGLEAD